MGVEEQFMRRALELARRGVGWTSPNPCVGAVLVRGHRVLGEGWHRGAGLPHAEIEALQDAKRRGHTPVEATLYVTLEPCCTQGRTPPCTEAIMAAGIRRVVVGATDPNPRHRGRGLRMLRAAGLQVTQGVLAEEARDLNKAFARWITTGRPWVIVKTAMSADGKIATASGDSRWITSVAARTLTHRMRAEVDALLVSAGTVVRDDPQLTVRHGVHGRQPWRVVVDARGRSPRTARLFRDAWRHRTVVVTTAKSSPSWRAWLAQQGVTVLVVAADGEHVNLRALLVALGSLEITSVMVEAGGDLVWALLDAGLVDELCWIYAPRILGGRAAPTAVDGVGVKRVRHAIRLRKVRWEPLPDHQLMLRAEVTR
ncbi:MAG: bifunctional diaminohydroxyphosphoribosylaminopyrimidine deaminase/5-amino-6-(5-phosphoribosylamino)uracil reductase RibD [Verrucomicrobiae bacterium]|nr:bifunctional diaminohydroxyphosphoribosylaminopyrimidine deaminase/5-amino-6-(5-phosphoribosylamino)uracil reductase RibD [Verrucomicrobiae bacterium]